MKSYSNLNMITGQGVWPLDPHDTQPAQPLQICRNGALLKSQQML